MLELLYWGLLKSKLFYSLSCSLERVLFLLVILISMGVEFVVWEIICLSWP